MVVFMFWNSKKKLKVLAFSGGSQKSVISLIIALKLEKELKKFNPDKEFIEYFDTVTAVSSGSIVASCLVIPSDKNPKKPKYSLNDCYKFFTKGSDDLNSKNTTWNKLLLFAGVKDYIVSSQEFEKILFQEADANKNVANLELSKTIIPINIISYDIENNVPRIWNTYEARSNPEKDFYLKDAVVASSAIPPLFSKKTTILKGQEKLIDYDGGIITPSPLFVSLPYISKVTNTSINDFFIIFIGTTIQDSKKILANFDKQHILLQAQDYINISQQITKPVFDNFLKHVYKKFYKLDLTVPSEIQYSLYNKNKRKDLDNYNKMIACTLKYIDENEKLFTALANKIADKKQDIRTLEKLYDESQFFCENPTEVLSEHSENVHGDL